MSPLRGKTLKNVTRGHIVREASLGCWEDHGGKVSGVGERL